MDEVKCSITDCQNVAQRIVKPLDAGYCLRHWKEVSGNLSHLHVLKLCPCPYCKWLFAGQGLLNKHINDAHVRSEPNATE